MRISMLQLGVLALCVAAPIAGCTEGDGGVGGGFGSFGTNWPIGSSDAGNDAALPLLDSGTVPTLDSGSGTLDAGGGFTQDAGSGVVDAGGGTSDAGPDASANAGDQDAGPSLDPTDPYAEVRQVCVETINDYRAGLGLAPLTLSPKAQQECSDDGAKLDADRNQAHYSANMCRGLGAQNTCPGWGIGGFTGFATLADALKGCLEQMWDEGEPPGGREACIQAYFDGDAACFLAHGHYLNMSSADNAQVACGFYEMPDGRFWMNQDFGR